MWYSKTHSASSYNLSRTLKFIPNKKYRDVFVMVLFEIVKKEKQPNCSSTEEEILKLVCFIQIMECYKAVTN